MNDNAQKYMTLRGMYEDFIYEGYTVTDECKMLNITYHFCIPGLARFDPTWSFTIPDSHRFDIDHACLNRLVFSLGMVELVSYWKISCPPCVRIDAGSLTDEQISWWKKLYFHGLGEFFYLNGIIPDDNFMNINCTSQRADLFALFSTDKSAASTMNSSQPRVLIPIGGGKDSALTLELLRGSAERYAYIINPRPATRNTVEMSGIGEARLITAKRTLDKNMLDLNTQGYLNGHTPFSAIVAFSSVLAGYLNGMDYVALSNESSANESTVAGSDVNHQYSKSFEFETDFRQYEREYIASGVEYFSLLRPLLELQIARSFAQYKQYHPVFQSCNGSEKTNEWCGTCPKCLFVYVILAPFLNESELRAIFGKNLFEDVSLFDTLDELAGFTLEKPFECVGRRDEVRAALEMTAAKYKEVGLKLPPVLLHYKETCAAECVTTCDIDNTDDAIGITSVEIGEILSYFDEANAVPAQFVSAVRHAAHAEALPRG